MSLDRTTIRQCILDKVRARGLEKTICPSEVARELGGEDWRAASQIPQGSLMPLVRSIAAELVESGDIQVTQRGKIVDPINAKGPIRFKSIKKVISRSL